MKARYVILIILIVLQLLLALLPIIPGLKEILPKEPTQREQLDWQIEVIGFGFAILTTCFALMVALQQKDDDKFRQSVLDKLPATKVIKMRDDDFYHAFLSAARQAKSTVNIMYLALVPPNHTQDRERMAYYAAMIKTIKKKRDVRFSRIVRYSDAMKPWIGDLLGELSGCPNASVCVIKESERERMPLSLSTQIVDGNKVWFVAIQDHERLADYRDLYVESDVVGEAMAYYFDRLWKRGEVLLEAGQITTVGQSYRRS